MNSLNADDISLGSQEASFVSPSKPQNGRSGPQKFLSKLTKPTGSTPLGEIKNNVRSNRVAAGKNEFTPLLKSVTKNQFLKRGLATRTPSKLKVVLSKSASTSDLPDITSDEGFSGAAEESHVPTEKELSDLSRASDSFQKLPTRSPGSNDGAALLTLREQEKVLSLYMEFNNRLSMI